MLSYKATPHPCHVQYFSNFSAYQKPLEGLLEQTVDSTNCISDSAISREVLRICILTEAWDFFPLCLLTFQGRISKVHEEKSLLPPLIHTKVPSKQEPSGTSGGRPPLSHQPSCNEARIKSKRPYVVWDLTACWWRQNRACVCRLEPWLSHASAGMIARCETHMGTVDQVPIWRAFPCEWHPLFPACGCSCNASKCRKSGTCGISWRSGFRKLGKYSLFSPLPGDTAEEDWLTGTGNWCVVPIPTPS